MCIRLESDFVVRTHHRRRTEETESCISEGRSTMGRHENLMILFCAVTTAALVAGRPYSNLIIHHEYHGPGAPLGKDGRVLDTDEVAEAKKNHFAIYAETLADLIKKMEAAKANLEAELGQQEQQQQAEGGEQQQPQAEAQAEPEAPKEPEAVPETKPVSEPEASNEVKGQVVVNQLAYEGPLAPLKEGGLVDYTPEVAKARANHLKILEEAAKQASKEEEPKGEETALAQYHQQEQQKKKIVYFAPLHFLYTHNAPIAYHGPLAPLGYDGRVVETSEVEQAKRAHFKAFEKAKSLAERNPPKPEDNNLI